MALINDVSGYIKAQTKFQGNEPLKMGVLSGVEYDRRTQKFRVRFLNDDYTVSYPDAQVYDFADVEPEIELKILLLHYLASSKDIPLAKELIPFNGLPSGVAYNQAFLNRVVYPISKFFSSNPRGFKKAAKILGGQKVDYGDLAFSIPVFPRIPLIYVLWLADEKLPGSANVLFDSSAKKTFTN